MRDFKVNILPSQGEPNARYYVAVGSNLVDEFITDIYGNYRKVSISNVSTSTYVHSQGVASTIWNIQHNLNYYPNVSIVDSAGNVMIGSIKYIDQNNIIATFSNGFSGQAYLS